ncbi:MAG: sulfotransferase [Candidatus Vecturithrix sp.]|jgi:hypothetical protein|nr:sulfotransferase [Candidatus Vecturithrix sp.]
MYNKIFNFGLPKTGTTSLNQALNILGFKSLHNPKNFRQQAMEGRYHFDRDDWQAITNFGEHFYPQLDQAYPNSKFILTVRDETAWLQSWRKQVGASTGDEVGARWAWTRKLRTWERGIKRILEYDTRITHKHARIDIFGTYTFHAERCLYVYRLHQKNAKEYFQDRPRDFLIMNIPEGDDWEKLCPFLEIDKIPDAPFPCNRPEQSPYA